MRISTNQMQFSAVNQMLDQQSKLSKTQQQIASGRRILKPSDDPVASANVLSLTQSKEITERYQLNADAARARLSIEESALIGVNNDLIRVRELALKGNNDTLTDADRRSVAIELNQILDELLGLANTVDSNGDYLFSGHQGNVQPFARNAGGGFTYNGDDGTRQIQVGPSRKVQDSDSGTAVFRAIRNGNGTFTTRDSATNTGSGIIDAGTVVGTFVPDTYTITFTQALPTDPITFQVDGVASGNLIPAGTVYQEGADMSFNGVSLNVKGQPANGDTFTVSPSTNQDIFSTVQNLITAFETGGSGIVANTQLHNTVNRVLVDLDQAQENVLNVRAGIGARLNIIDSQVSNNDDLLLQVQETLSVINDLDYAEAISRLNLQMTGLQAAQKAFTRVQNLSLFNFL